MISHGHRRASQRERVLASVKGRRCAPSPLRGASPLTPAPRTLIHDWPLDDDALSDAPYQKTVGRVGGAGRSYGMPVRSGLRSYRPERSVAINYYWSIVYMVSMLHSDQYGAERNNVDPPDQGHRSERDEDARST